MTRHARQMGLLLVVAYAAAGCAASGYNPPEGPRAANDCPVSQVRVCQDRYPSRLENDNEPPMICTCQDIHNVH